MNPTNDALDARIAMYALLSRLFMYEIDEKTVESLRINVIFCEYFSSCAQWDEFLHGDVKALCETILGPEFVNLFLLWLVPYESFYTGGNAMIESGSQNETSIFYKQFGFEADLVEARAVSPDFFALECEFLHHVVKSEREALERGDKEYAAHIRSIEKEFLQKHILPFAMMFLPSVISAATVPFYSDLAHTAMEFLLEEYEALSVP